MNLTTRFSIVGLGGAGVFRKLIALFLRETELHLALITLINLFGLKIAQIIEIKNGAVSYLFQHLFTHRFNLKKYHNHENPTGHSKGYSCPHTNSQCMYSGVMSSADSSIGELGCKYKRAQ